MSLPIWLTSEHQDRLRERLEAEGFMDVAFAAGPHMGDVEIACGAHRVIVRTPMMLDLVVQRFKKLRGDEFNG